MQWNFPFSSNTTCGQCGKEFEMIFTGRDSTRHECPHCGQIHTFDFDAAEQKLTEEAHEAVRDAFGDITFTLGF
jgi:hypothetical protein